MSSKPSATPARSSRDCIRTLRVGSSFGSTRQFRYHIGQPTGGRRRRRPVHRRGPRRPRLRRATRRLRRGRSLPVPVSESRRASLGRWPRALMTLRHRGLGDRLIAGTWTEISSGTCERRRHVTRLRWWCAEVSGCETFGMESFSTSDLASRTASVGYDGRAVEAAAKAASRRGLLASAPSGRWVLTSEGHAFVSGPPPEVTRH